MRIMKYLVAAVVSVVLAVAVGGVAHAEEPYYTICWDGQIVIDPYHCTPLPKPTITAAATTEPNAAGWYQGAVTIHFTCLPSLRGNGTVLGAIPDGGCPPDEVLTSSGTSTPRTVSDEWGTTSEPSNTITVQIDSSPPIVSAVRATAPNDAGWFRTPVPVHFVCTDVGDSGLDGACPSDEVLTASGSSTPVTVTDVAGNVSAPSNTVEVKIDAIAPTITASTTSVPNAAGWHRKSVIVVFACADEGGSEVATCVHAVSLASSGADQVATGRVSDAAGNVAAVSLGDIDIDLDAPTITWTGGPVDGETYAQGAVPAAPTCTAADALSGADACTVTGYETTQGTHTVTATATDLAGNTTTESRTYVVLAGSPTASFLPVRVSVQEVECTSSARVIPLSWKTPERFWGCYRVTVSTGTFWSTSAVFQLGPRFAGL